MAMHAHIYRFLDLTVEDAAADKAELFWKITNFLWKYSDANDYKNPHYTYVYGRKVVTGIAFTYPLPEKIEVDLSVSCNFSDHDALLTSLQGTNKKKRKLYVCKRLHSM